MTDKGRYFDRLAEAVGADFANRLRERAEDVWAQTRHGDMDRWQDALERLPECEASILDLSRGAVRIGAKEDMDDSRREVLREALMEFHPWRKGPFELFGVHIDTEWRSDFKWERIKDGIGSLAGQSVLDVGSGNGYYALRMLGAGAKVVAAVDPLVLYVMQFEAVNRYAKPEAAAVLPLKFEEVPEGKGLFDAVFSMGVLYHQRQPAEHLRKLGAYLKADGRLVLETLILEGAGDEVLVPEGRYGKMRNVWHVPTVGALKGWLSEAGFGRVDVIDVTPTTVDEQRATEWMRFESLADFLDPQDFSRTIEGYPAPVRAAVVARS